MSLLGSQTSRPNDGASSAEVGVITGCMWIWAILLILLVLVRDPLWLCPVVLVIGFAGPG